MGSEHISPQWLMRLGQLGGVTGKLLLLALAYYFTARFGLAIPYKSTFITLVWLAAGIAVAALLRWRLSHGPDVYANVFLAEISVGFPWYVCASLGVTRYVLHTGPRLRSSMNALRKNNALPPLHLSYRRV